MNEKKTNKLDYTLLFLLILLACISFISLYTTQQAGLVAKGDDYLSKQVTWYLVSIPVLVAVTFIDLYTFKQLSLYIYFGCLLMLAGILIMPENISPIINGAKGWYRIGGFSFQPAEITKIGLILVLSYTVSKANDTPGKLSRKSELKLLLKMLLYFLPLIFFMKAFPDLGSLLVYGAIFVSILLISKIRMSTLSIIFAIPAVIAAFLFTAYFYFTNFFFNKILTLLPSYQTDRFYGWLKPFEYDAAGYQTRQSIKNIGAGQLFGFDNLSNIPYAYSDFIFSVISATYGFLGASLVIVIYFLLIYRIIIISIEYQDAFGSYVGTGIIGMITYQVFQNIGMSIGLLPVTGLALPFISYGGSSLITSMIAMGLIFNMKMRTKKYMFEE